MKRMKPIVWVGILPIVFGALALTHLGFTYTHQEKVLDVGPIHATAEKHDRVSIPPIFGGLALAGESHWSSLEPRKPFSSKPQKCPASESDDASPSRDVRVLKALQ
jgi:hypothetical protein